MTQADNNEYIEDRGSRKSAQYLGCTQLSQLKMKSVMISLFTRDIVRNELLMVKIY